MTRDEADAAYRLAYLQGNEQAMIAYGELSREREVIPEIEITDEMVIAGAAILEAALGDATGRTDCETYAREVIEAALRART